MLRIALQSPKWGSTSSLRQTSQYSGCIEGTQYLINNSIANKVNYLLLSDPALGCDVDLQREKKIFIYMENPKIWIPNAEFLEQIGILISPFDLCSIIPEHINFIRNYPCVPWFYGIQFCTNSGLLHKPLRSRLELDEMLGMVYPSKTKLLSMIASGKAGTPGHSWRRDLAVALKSYFGDLVDIFGFGHKPVPDKRVAIDPYVFSIVIENDEADYYVTEKVVDCLIGWSIPIYSGAKQLDSLLDQEVLRIPFGCSVDYAVNVIKAAVSSGGMSHDALARMRSTAMHRLNLFEELPRLLLQG